MIRFCSLGSGSAGNATVIEATSGITTTRLLVDAGFSLRELALRLARAGLEVGDIDAVFVTHEHGDHVGCSLALAEQRSVPIWMSRGTWRSIGLGAVPSHLRFARDGESIAVGDMELQPFTVAHDAAEPLQLCVDDGSSRLAVLTDIGSITEHVAASVAACRALILECNHDSGLLAASRYPASVKARIAGRFGHLSNAAATQFLRGGIGRQLHRLVAGHLSLENNRPDLARAALADAWGSEGRDVVVADQACGFSWLSI